MVKWSRASGCHEEGHVRFLACGYTKTFVVVRNLLNELISTRLSKDSGSLLLKHTIQSQEQQKYSLQTLYTLELDLGPFPIDGAHFIPNDQWCHLL